MADIIDLFKEASKKTGKPMFIGCPECGVMDWAVTVFNINDFIIIDQLKCTGCGAECSITDGVIDD